MVPYHLLEHFTTTQSWPRAALVTSVFFAQSNSFTASNFRYISQIFRYEIVNFPQEPHRTFRGPDLPCDRRESPVSQTATRGGFRDIKTIQWRHYQRSAAPVTWQSSPESEATELSTKWIMTVNRTFYNPFKYNIWTKNGPAISKISIYFAEDVN